MIKCDLNMKICVPAAFTNAVLCDARWLIGGQSADPKVRSNHVWNDILSMDDAKQLVFLHRILYLHDLATRRAGKSAPVRLTLQEWAVEADRMALGTYILKAMSLLEMDDGSKVFDDAILETVKVRLLEGSLN